jgi:hypothetical protein
MMASPRVALKILQQVLRREEAEPKRPARGALLKTIVAEIQSTSGRGLSIAKLSRLQNGHYIRPPYGLRETAVRKLFRKRISQKAQLEELALRMLHYRRENLTYPLLEAKETLSELSDQLDGAAARADCTDEEYEVARAAVSSLAQQIALYRLGLATHKEVRGARAIKAREHGARAFAELKEELCQGGSLAVLILAARVIVNDFFATYVMDEVAGEKDTLPRTREFARQYGNPSVFKAVFRWTELTYDPRVARYSPSSLCSARFVARLRK